MILCPARLEPIFSPRPWGSLSLAPFFPDKSNLAEPLGEAWMTGSECRFGNGPFAGQKLGEAWPKMPPEWTGTAVDRSGDFPLLVKFLFPEDKLSVQVHPDDDYAARHEQAAGGRGKTEMWYAVNARPGAEVLVGLKPSVTRESFSRAIADGTAEDCLERIPLRPGDAVFVPARTAHTIGPGLVLCEIQQNSDITYRVYDYNRRDAKGQPRPLHIEKALEVMRFGKQFGGKIEPVLAKSPKKAFGFGTRTLFVACPHFAVERIEYTKLGLLKPSPERFELAIVLDGAGRISWGERENNSAEYSRGQVWLIPAALGFWGFECKSPTTILRTYVPGDLEQLCRIYEWWGVNPEEMSRLVRR
jgi:mannose-6-phosphate isomerase